jgi:hypothetical protein
MLGLVGRTHADTALHPNVAHFTAGSTHFLLINPTLFWLVFLNYLDARLEKALVVLDVAVSI